jgi:FtsZ-binding cell division protein ZapB
LQETLAKEKVAHEETITNLHAEVHKLKELNAEIHAEERKKERELRAAIYDERLQTER